MFEIHQAYANLQTPFVIRVSYTGRVPCFIVTSRNNPNPIGKTYRYFYEAVESANLLNR